MKEKIIVFLLCCIVLTLIFLDAGPGQNGRKVINSYINSNIFEKTFVLKTGNEKQHEFVRITNQNNDIGNESLSLYSLSACMIDADNGRILFEKDAGQIRAMASTTKIMTCLVALEQCPIDDIVTFSDYAASMPDVQLNAKSGEQFRMYDLLLSLMLESHNDTAVAIAEHVGGSVDMFCKMMTQRAQEIGCENTVFLTPNGLDKEITTEEGEVKHSTTAYDLALIMRECIKNEQFVSLCRTKSAVIQNKGKTMNYTLSNHNALLTMMDGVIAGKTGFTCDAGYCYVGAVKRNNSVYICSLLGCGWPNHKNYKWYDMEQLITYGETSFVRVSFPDENIESLFANNIKIMEGIADGKIVNDIPISRKKQEQNEVLMRDGEIIEITGILPTCLQAPIAKGDIVGEIIYKINGQTIFTESLTASASVEQMKFRDYFSLVLSDYIFSGSSLRSSEKCSS